MRLLVNENLPAPALRSLRAAGFDVLAVAENMSGATDSGYGEMVFLQELPSPPAIVFLGDAD